MTSSTEICFTKGFYGYGVQPEHPLRRRTWTAEQDAIIMRAWQESDRKRIPWSAVAAAEGVDRSPNACYKRWYNYLRFTISQDKTPPISAKEHSEKIDSAGKLNLCEGALAPKQEQRRRAPLWTEAENEVMIRAWQEAVASRKHMPWRDITAKMGTGRTVAACRRHWGKYVKHQFLSMKKTEHAKPLNKILLKQAKVETDYIQRLNNELMQVHRDFFKERTLQEIPASSERSENVQVRVTDVVEREVFDRLQQVCIHSDMQDSSIRSSSDNSIVEQMCKEYGYTYEDI